MGNRHGVYVCRRMRVLSYLTELGFKYDYVLPDPRNKDYLQWVFIRNDDLTKALDAYFESRRRAKEMAEN